MGRGAPRAGMSPVPAISASEPDWSREVPRSWWDPGYRLLRAVRRYQAARGRLSRKYWAIQHWFWSTVTQSEIHLNQDIGGGPAAAASDRDHPAPGRRAGAELPAVPPGHAGAGRGPRGRPGAGRSCRYRRGRADSGPGPDRRPRAGRGQRGRAAGRARRGDGGGRAGADHPGESGRGTGGEGGTGMRTAMRTGAEIPMKPQCVRHPAAIAVPGPAMAAIRVFSARPAAARPAGFLHGLPASGKFVHSKSAISSQIRLGVVERV